MYRYFNRIIEKLIENLEISRYDLYFKCGAGDKRVFLNKINSLLTKGEIIYEERGVRGPVYYPKTHWLSIYLKAGNIYLEKIRVNFIPSKVLEEELEYVKPGTEPEDEFEFQLQIAGGYPIEEKHKAFLELHNNISLNFDKFSYVLSVVYYNKSIQSDYFKEKKINILYVDNNRSFAIDFIKKVKQEYLPDSNWHFFTDTGQAIYFLENKIEIQEVINLIITEHNAVLNGIEFIEAVRELEMEFKEKYIELNIPIMAFTKKDDDLSYFKKNNSYGYKRIFAHLLKSEDLYVIGNAIKYSGPQF